MTREDVKNALVIVAGVVLLPLVATGAALIAIAVAILGWLAY